jgi:hypothetical protein
MTTDPTSADDRAATPQRRARRRHPATGARILAGSLSAAAALGLMGTMAGAAGPTTDEPTTSTADATSAPAAPRVTPTAAAPATTSRGS